MSADPFCWRCAGTGEYQVARLVNGEWVGVVKPCRCRRATLSPVEVRA